MSQPVSRRPFWSFGRHCVQTGTTQVVPAALIWVTNDDRARCDCMSWASTVMSSRQKPFSAGLAKVSLSMFVKGWKRSPSSFGTEDCSLTGNGNDTCISGYP